MKQFLNTIQRVLDQGVMIENDRTGVGRLTIFHATESYDLTGNILPLVTTCKTYIKPTMKELFGMIKGSNKVEDLGEKFWSRWSPDADFVKKSITDSISALPVEEHPSAEALEKMLAGASKHPGIGTIGPMYGVLWRDWPLVDGRCDFTWLHDINDIASDRFALLSQEFDRVCLLSNGQLENTKENRMQFIGDMYVRSLDQLNRLYLGLKRKPFSTHHRLTAFNPSLIGPNADARLNVIDGYGALSPCHPLFQLNVIPCEGGLRLDSHLYMGSSDVCLGRRYNIAFYSLMTMMFAHCLGYKVGHFHLTTANTHIYTNHIEKAKEQVKLTPYENKTVVTINPEVKDFFALKPEDISISGYESHPYIDYEANV